MYNANDIAKYIINYAMEQNSPVTNLKLQKLLYYLWIEFFKKKREWLFDNTIRAWPLGPVVPDVYDEFCAYGGFPIRQKFDIDLLQKEDKNIIDLFLEKFFKYTTKELVDMSHAHGKPWDKIFLNGEGRSKRIPFKMIIEDECN